MKVLLKKTGGHLLFKCCLLNCCCSIPQLNTEDHLVYIFSCMCIDKHIPKGERIVFVIFF